MHRRLGVSNNLCRVYAQNALPVPPLGPAFWQKAVIMGNLPVVIPFFQRQTPLQHLPAWLLFAAFGQLLFIFCSEFIAVMCTRITRSPFHFFFELVCISCFFFFFFSIYHLFSLPGPLRAVLLVPRVSQPLLKVTPILIVVIKSKETERG